MSIPLYATPHVDVCGCGVKGFRTIGKQSHQKRSWWNLPVCEVLSLGDSAGMHQEILMGLECRRCGTFTKAQTTERALQLARPATKTTCPVDQAQPYPSLKGVPNDPCLKNRVSWLYDPYPRNPWYFDTSLTKRNEKQEIEQKSIGPRNKSHCVPIKEVLFFFLGHHVCVLLTRQRGVIILVCCFCSYYTPIGKFDQGLAWGDRIKVSKERTKERSVRPY
jgi:hypothetical protein